MTAHVRLRLGVLALAAALLGPSAAGQIEPAPGQPVSMEGVTQADPCTFAPLVFHGALSVSSRFKRDGSGGTVYLHVAARGVSATGGTTGAEFRTVDSFDVMPHVDPLPARTAATVSPKFRDGAAEPPFTAQITLEAAVTPEGLVDVTLGDVVLQCK